MRDIVILISDGCLASSVTGPQDLFRVANSVWQYLEQDDTATLFRIKLVSADGGSVTTSSGIVIQAEAKLSEIDSCDFLLIAAYHYDSSNALADYIAAQRVNHLELKRLHQVGCRIGAYCSATFVLADSGLLNDCVATTSWWLERAFRAQFPEVKVNLKDLVVEDNNLWTAGATTSYLNLCLKIIEQFCGIQIASQVSKVLLVDQNHRSQLPYMTLANPTNHKDSIIAKCQQWVQQNLSKSISLQDMSDRCAMSKRNFIRRFKKAVGETPATYLQRIRIEAAKRYLENTDLNLEQIIEKVGYEDTSAFRRVFQKLTSLSPSAYRTKFSA